MHPFCFILMLYQFIACWNACGGIRCLETVGSSNLSGLYAHIPAGSHVAIRIIWSIIYAKNNRRSDFVALLPQRIQVKAVGVLPSVLPDMVSVQDQTVGGHWAKGTKKRDSKHKMSTNSGISPSLSITLWSHMKKKWEELSRSSLADRRSSSE